MLLRIDGSGGQVLAFDNMNAEGIIGTRDWQPYSITLNYPEDATGIYVAGILVGQGEAWFDAFTVTIDGEDIQTKAEEAPKTYPADEDTVFDAGSKVTFPELNPPLIADLDLLGRVWGFLKYHHPAIARGERQWDFDLFRVLPEYLGAGSQVQRETVLEEWITALGAVPPCTECAQVDTDVVLTASLDWIGSAITSDTLRQQLRHIYTNRPSGDDHYYIAAEPGVGNPKFRHERPYETMAYPDAGFRLLAVYRYWNMIRYFFPYVAETDNDWEEILATYIPRFLEAENEPAYEQAALELIAEVNDTHANLWDGGDKLDEQRGDRYATVHLRFVEDELTVTDYYETTLSPATDLAIGDVITEIDGTPVTELVDSLRTGYPASNQPTQLRNLSADLLRGTTDRVAVRVRTADGEVVTRGIPRFAKEQVKPYRWYPERDAPAYELLSEDIGYVTLQNIKQEDIPVIQQQLKDTKGIVIDIRNYPSAFMPFTLAPWFLTEDMPFVRFTTMSVATPGDFILSEPREIPAAPEPYTGKVVVLVNELTQSQAEYTAMAFRASPLTTIIGSTTAGADGNYSNITLPGGLSTGISGIGIFYPDGTPTQRIGIVPDIEVPLTLEAVRSGRDELLERAIELIEKGS